MSPEPVDYAAEVRRTRLAQGLEADVPQDVRDAVAALITDSLAVVGPDPE